MMETAKSRPWSDLEPELLGLVLRRLSSIADRVRLRAVCKPWRSNSLQPLPLPFPWLTLPDGTFLNIPGGEIHHMLTFLPDATACCHCSIDDWLFLMSTDGACSLVNPFSKSILQLPELPKVWKRGISNPYSRISPIFYKLVVPSSPLDSAPDSLVAALIMDDDDCSTICINQPPTAPDLFRGNAFPELQIEDIAFFDGKLYALCGFGKLCIVHLKDLIISPPECIIRSLYNFGGIPESLSKVDTSNHTVRVYLVECGGRLLIVKRWFESIYDLEGDCVSVSVSVSEHTVALQVLEADLSTNPGRWRRVNDLDGHALFLGQCSSKSLAATECSGCREDCIYFMGDSSHPPYSVNPVFDSGVYNMRNGKITPLLPEAAATSAHHAGEWCPTWLFPPEIV
ncbi:hypothetical protein ACQ4PT_034822 [Festuca glaucescens]